MEKERDKTKKPMTRAQLAVILFVSILVVMAANVVLFLATPSSNQEDEQAALFGVNKIVVEGNTRYDDEAIIAYSGLRIGQSIFSVNKEQAAENVRAAFTYVEEVTVHNDDSSDVMTIVITEAKPLGVMDLGDQWMLVSTTGRGLQAWDKDGNEPLRYLRLKGATTKNTQVGAQVLDERSMAIMTSLREELAKHNLQDINAVDMTDKTNIQVNWNNQITFLMGSDAHMARKIAVIAATLPKVLDEYGDHARGTLNVRDYSDDTAQKKYIIFRPEGLVTTTTTTTSPSSTDPTATGTDGQLTDPTAA